VIIAATETTVYSARLAPGKSAIKPDTPKRYICAVAVRGDDVLVAAPSPKEVVAWLAQHRQRAQSMFRVVDSEQAITGAAPQ
jgi:hypothetical protein